MNKPNLRTVKDSMGEMQVPESALYAAQTQRAVENFPVSDLKMPSLFIRSIALLKAAAADANLHLKLLDKKQAEAIIKAAQLVATNDYDEQFPIDVFQTGSGTSSNMNANEVIACLANNNGGVNIHPNDHVNMGQSSNDVIPSTIAISTSLATHEKLLPALDHLIKTLENRANEFNNLAKTGRTHLMDAMPVTLGQELECFSEQIRNCKQRLEHTIKEVQCLAIGGTAVGTGINAHPKFSKYVCKNLSHNCKIDFSPAKNLFINISTQDSIVAFSGQCRTLSVSLMKIANDLRWMNSGPLAGIGEIQLPALQPGSSIMPGKVNPVIAESMAMICAQVIGNDSCITVAGQSGNFQLNVMLPVIAYNILQSCEILANGAKMLADKAISGFTVNEQNIKDKVAKNPILITALNSVIGYELGAKIAKSAYQEQRPLLDVAKEMTDLSESELQKLLDPMLLTKGGIVGAK